MEIEAVHLLVATGSVPRPLAKLELDGEHVVTPQQLLKSAETIPQVYPLLFILGKSAPAVFVLDPRRV